MTRTEENRELAEIIDMLDKVEDVEDLAAVQDELDRLADAKDIAEVVGILNIMVEDTKYNVAANRDFVLSKLDAIHKERNRGK